jgi:hypothetical protein
VATLAQIGERHAAIDDEPLSDMLTKAARAGDEYAQALIDGGSLEMPIVPQHWERLSIKISKMDIT